MAVEELERHRLRDRGGEQLDDKPLPSRVMRRGEAALLATGRRHGDPGRVVPAVSARPGRGGPTDGGRHRGGRRRARRIPRRRSRVQKLGRTDDPLAAAGRRSLGHGRRPERRRHDRRVGQSAGGGGHRGVLAGRRDPPPRRGRRPRRQRRGCHRRERGRYDRWLRQHRRYRIPPGVSLGWPGLVRGLAAPRRGGAR